MKKFIALILLTLAVSAQAELHDRGAGLIYDDVLDITWTRSASYKYTDDWNGAVAWASSFTLNDSVRHVTWSDWRLASMDVNGDGAVINCSIASELLCRDNEYGYLYHYYGIDSLNEGPFSGISTGYYWSGTQYASDASRAWYFGSFNGNNYHVLKTQSGYSWAVRDGDVAALPVEVDVDPWGDSNIVKPHTNNQIIVAVMGMSTFYGDPVDFNVSGIKPASLKLGGGLAPNIANNPLYGYYNDDEILDVAFIFETPAAEIDCPDKEVTLWGVASANQPFTGTSPIDTQECEAAVLPLDNPSPDKSDNYGDRFGVSVSVSGGRVLVGSPRDSASADLSGRAYLFDAATGKLERTFENPEPVRRYWDWFGVAVSISGDRVLIGSEYDIDETTNTNSGRAYLFDAVTGNLERTFNNPSSSAGDFFGSSLSVSGDRVLVGAVGDDATGSSSGRAYLFDAVTGSLLHTFENPSPDDQDLFGSDVSVSGDRVVVSAYGDDTLGASAGRVYVFDAITGGLIHTLENPGSAPAGDYFGESVSISGDRIIVGAYGEYTDGVSYGRAYQFDAVSGDLVHTFMNPAPLDYRDYFGAAVSVSGDTVLIGADRHPTGGRAFLFDAVTGDLLKVLENPSPDNGDNFGTAVAMSGDKSVVGASRDNTMGGQGRAYLFFDGLPADIEAVVPAGAPYNGSLHPHHQASPDDIVPVVVLGRDTSDGDEFDLDVSQIDVASVRMGPDRAPLAPGSTPDLNYDHDNDGNPDALFEFRMSETGFYFEPANTARCYAPVVLTGTMQLTGERFAGEDLTVDTDCEALCH